MSFATGCRNPVRVNMVNKTIIIVVKIREFLLGVFIYRQSAKATEPSFNWNTFYYACVPDHENFFELQRGLFAQENLNEREYENSGETRESGY